jgi:hypothetical protein
MITFIRKINAYSYLNQMLEFYRKLTQCSINVVLLYKKKYYKYEC